MVDRFVFEATPELDKGVVVAIAFAAHGGDEAMLNEHLWRAPEV